MSGTILLYVQAPVFPRAGGGLLVERQAVNGLRLWAENFGHVIAMAPLGRGTVPPGWVPWPDHARIALEPVPDGYRIDRFLRHAPRQARRIARLIDRADYLCFAIGGLAGDWGAVGAMLAHRKGRGYAIWTDRVESAVTRRAGQEGRGRHALKARLAHRPMAALERHVIRRADLGLFHGAETYQAYAPHAKTAVLAHDIHLPRGAHIDDAALAARRAACAGRPLRLGYAGRVHWSKGWRDWLEVVARLVRDGAQVEAAWLGGGPDLEAMRARAAALDLSGRVSLPGFVDDRAAVLAALRRFDLLLFCHLTPESPRVLIEALSQGTPIAGYGDAYSRDLVAQAGGGVLVPRGDVAGLAAAVAQRAADRPALSELMGRAAQDGRRFDDETVFAHRSAAIRAHVRPRPGCEG